MAKKHRILFLCKGNSVRSQMAEAITRHIAGRYFDAFSAGSDPVPAVHPQALETLRRNRVPVDGLAPKDLLIFEGQSFDSVVCLCDRDREEPTHIPGADVMQWRFPDPAGSPESERAQAFENVFRGLETRIRLLMMVTIPRPAHAPSLALAAV
jgi:arsenate reductase